MSAEAKQARREAANWFILLREDPADEGLKSEFATWLAADPLHATAWSSIGETAGVIGRAAEEMQHRDARQAASPQAPQRRRSDRRRWRDHRPRRNGWKVGLGTAAAACALLVALPTLQLHLDADHVTGAAQVVPVRLADGSTVQLGPDSAIAVSYSPSGRTVRLVAGQALFEIQHDPSRPFRVEAGKVTTTVLGTGFDVRRIGGATSVAVRHGRVRVDDANTSPVASRVLTAGQWVRLEAGARPDTGMEDPKLVGAWLSGDILARNRPIKDVVDEIRPWYSGHIVIADTALAGRPVTGVYNVRDPAGALALIVNPYGGRVLRITPWLMVIIG